MNEHDRDEAAAEALGILSADEAAELQARAARSPELAAELEGYRAAVAMLGTGAVREAPPGDLFDRVLAAVEEDRAPAAAPLEEPRAPTVAPGPTLGERLRRLWPAFGAGVATAAAAIALVFALSGDGLGPADARAAVAGTEEFPGVTGEATLYHSDAEDGVLRLDLSSVPPAAEGEHYEVWVLREAGEGEMEAVGVFRPTGTSVDLELRLPGPGPYRAVDVSLEPDGGSPEHSGRSLAGGEFET